MLVKPLRSGPTPNVWAIYVQSSFMPIFLLLERHTNDTLLSIYTVRYWVHKEMKNVAFLVRVSLAVSEKYPQTKTTPNYSVLQNVQPSDDITPLTQQAYYHLLGLVGYFHIIFTWGNYCHGWWFNQSQSDTYQLYHWVKFCFQKTRLPSLNG